MRTRPTRRGLVAAAVVILGMAAVAGPVLVLVTSSRSQAAFGRQAEVRGRLSSATLDVEPGQRTVPVTVGALAPGDRATGSIEVVNVGSLPLHYALLIQPSDTPVERWLRWDLWFAGPGQACGGRTPSDALVRGAVLGGATIQALAGRADAGLDPGDRVLAPGDRELICTAVVLPFDAPDGVQGAAVNPAFTVAAEQHLEAGA
jgi:hypothetical protein